MGSNGWFKGNCWFIGKVKSKEKNVSNTKKHIEKTIFVCVSNKFVHLVQSVEIQKNIKKGIPGNGNGRLKK